MEEALWLGQQPDLDDAAQHGARLRRLASGLRCAERSSTARPDNQQTAPNAALHLYRRADRRDRDRGGTASILIRAARMDLFDSFGTDRSDRAACERS